ncbi:hypothetical protein ACJ72_00725 [Emergomyces africanus]|uniref:DUF2293 domain-containing protein n=1 Tax=Emergomyces africanus TaxID=1955775 RepID=A0A1B7P7C9_9EURO|nr:hypothetical protein ACJ72_00725 [Emergomyces africanus]
MSISFPRSWPCKVPILFFRGTIQSSSVRQGPGNGSLSFQSLRKCRIIARSISSTPIKQPNSPDVNIHGETVLADVGRQLPGYAFVPLENKFMLRQCRKLKRASNDSKPIFVRHASPHRSQELGPELGIYAPQEVVEQASREFAKLTALLDHIIWKKWEHEYPQIPAADKMKLRRLVSEKNANAIATLSTHVAESTLWGYVCRTYTSDEHLVLSAARNPKVALQMREKIDGVLESWRG